MSLVNKGPRTCPKFPALKRQICPRFIFCCDPIDNATQYNSTNQQVCLCMPGRLPTARPPMVWCVDDVFQLIRLVTSTTDSLTNDDERSDANYVILSTPGVDAREERSQMRACLEFINRLDCLRMACVQLKNVKGRGK